MKNNHISTNPPLIANGGVTVVEEGVAMDGISGYLDAGDGDSKCDRVFFCLFLPFWGKNDIYL